MSNFIGLHEPEISGNEWKYIKECLDTEWVSSAGKFVDLFEKKVAEFTGSNNAVACVNGTSALHVSLRLVGVMPGDEVIVPTLTFIAPINAVSYNGAVPIFMDSDKYFNIDVEKTILFLKNETALRNGFTYNKKTNKRISALIPVHVWGNAVYLDELIVLCREMNIAIVEDASESLGTFYNKGDHKNNHTGTLAQAGCLSFNGNKIITTGGGGMILINNNDLAEKARYLTTQAKDDSIKYIHNEIGYNFRLTNIQAALGLAQLEQLKGFLQRKKQIYSFYKKTIQQINGLSIASVPDYSDNNHWMNILQIDSDIFGESKEQIMKRLKNNNVETRPIWALNHMQKPYKDNQIYEIDNAMELINKSLCLPSSPNLVIGDKLKGIINKLINK